jgi:hypothetical protein
MPAAITCSSCNRPLRVPESVLGQTVQCPLCLDEFTAQADAAAEAAARAAEEPARRAAARPQPVAAQIQSEPEQAPILEISEEPVSVEPIHEVMPVQPAARKVGERRGLVFPVIVTRDPDRVLRGSMDGELAAEGLYLRRMRMSPAFAAVGARARYLGTNRLVVTIEGREVEISIVKPWAATYHMARDVAAFLNGQGAFPDARAYNLPWYLYTLPVLFIALPSVAIPLGLFTDGCLGAFVWVVIAVVLAGLTLVLAMQSWLRPRGRLIGATAMLGVGAAVLLLSIPFTPAYTVDPSLWKSFSPPGAGLTVLMPGTPAAGKPIGFNAVGQKYVSAVADPDVEFVVFVADAPANNPNGLPFGNSVAQAVNDAKTRLVQDFNANGFNSVIQQYQYPERDGYLGRSTYHDVTYKVTPGGYGYNSAQAKMLAVRIYVVNGKEYTLAALGPRVKADGSDMVKFFNSVQFTTPAKTAVVAPPSPKEIPGLLAYWSFDDLQGGFGPIDANLNDEAGRSAPATLHQAAPSDGKRGKGVHFNGQGSYFDYSSAPGLDFGKGAEFTIAAWVRTGNPSGVIVSQRSSHNANAIIDLKLVNGQLTAVVWPAGKNYAKDAAEFSGGNPINDANWHHVALTRRQDGTTELFIDGASVVSHLAQGTAGPIITDWRALGSERSWELRGDNASGEASDFTGDVDEFCIFNRALTPAQILKLASPIAQ